MHFHTNLILIFFEFFKALAETRYYGNMFYNSSFTHTQYWLRRNGINFTELQNYGSSANIWDVWNTAADEDTVWSFLQGEGFFKCSKPFPWLGNIYLTIEDNLLKFVDNVPSYKALDLDFRLINENLQIPIEILDKYSNGLQYNLDLESRYAIMSSSAKGKPLIHLYFQLQKKSEITSDL